MAHVEVDGPRLGSDAAPACAGSRHAFAGDGAGHHIARGEFQLGMVALHKALAAIVAQVRALAAQGFRDEEARRAGERERGGMELVKLHVGQLGAGQGRQSDAVAGSDGGIGGVGVDLARAAGGNQDGARANAHMGAQAGCGAAASDRPAADAREARRWPDRRRSRGHRRRPARKPASTRQSGCACGRGQRQRASG